MIKRIIRKLRGMLYGSVSKKLSLQPNLPLPEDISEQRLFDFVTAIRVSDAPEAEMKAYGTHDFRRFVYTLGLTQGLTGDCLELGANPYFTTMLLKQFRSFNLTLANFFSAEKNARYGQAVGFRDLISQRPTELMLEYDHFNVENDPFPYPDSSFDLVIFAEIIEHMLNDPCAVLREIHRVLKPGGRIILTTPNVARLENVARLVAGENIYDPYSGYGPYGRHNREYNRHELIQLLKFEGFVPEQHFTADVHANNAAAFASLDKLKPLLQFRSTDLGQYIFVRAYKQSAAQKLRPSWLYRSYPADQLL